MSHYPLAGKVVLITGAGRGLGAATASRLVERGAVVVVADIDLPSARSVVATLPPGRGLALECDVTDLASARSAVEAAVERFGRVDVAVANAGVLGRAGTLRSLRPEDVAGVMAVNVEGVVNTVSAAIESVISSRGQIVLVSSVFAFVNGAGAIRSLAPPCRSAWRRPPAAGRPPRSRQRRPEHRARAREPLTPSEPTGRPNAPGHRSR